MVSRWSQPKREKPINPSVSLKKVFIKSLPFFFYSIKEKSKDSLLKNIKNFKRIKKEIIIDIDYQAKKTNTA